MLYGPHGVFLVEKCFLYPTEKHFFFSLFLELGSPGSILNFPIDWSEVMI